jgi:hypothetical protein
MRRNGVIGRFAHHGRTVGRNHDVILVGQAAQGGDVAIIDRLQRVLKAVIAARSAAADVG